MSLTHNERHRWVKEISEINKKINVGQGGSGGAAQPARPVERPLPPGMIRGLGGPGMVNMLAPHLQKGGT